MQLSPLSISRTLSSLQTETLYSINNNPMFPLTAAFRDHCSTFSLYEFYYSRCPYKWNNTILAPLCLAYFTCGFPGGSDSKESACNAGDLGLIPGLGRSPGGGIATHSSILVWRISMDRGAWRSAIHRVTKSWTRLSD